MGVDVNWDSVDGEDAPAGKPVPGTYRFRAVECTEGSSAAGKYLQLVCDNMDKPKWKLRERFYFTPRAMSATKMRLKGLGVPKGLTPLKPHYLVGVIFEAICKVEQSKPKEDGRVYVNLQIDVFCGAEGYDGGIKLIVPSVNMPKGAVATPDEEDDGSEPF